MINLRILIISTITVGTAYAQTQWLTPPRSLCTQNGGKISADGICMASWHKAKQICKAQGGRLADFEELEKVMRSCGGKLNDYKNNRKNASYQKCYKKEGFSSLEYSWSSTPIGHRSRDAWFLDFSNGGKNYLCKQNEYSVRCIKDE